MPEEYKGKCTVIVESDTMTTRQIEEALHTELNHIQEFGFSDLDECSFYIVPSDDI